jgi:hypothetical protein
MAAANMATTDTAMNGIAVEYGRKAKRMAEKQNAAVRNDTMTASNGQSISPAAHQGKWQRIHVE